MRGYQHNTDGHLSERHLFELADLLAIQLHERLGSRVYMLQRGDIIDLITPFVEDLPLEDRRTISWMLWHLFQDALAFELGSER